MSELHYGKNVEWFLRELSAHEAGDIESVEIEIIGENDQGVEGSTTIDITLLAADAVSVISALQQKLDAVLAENVVLKEGNQLALDIICDDNTYVALPWQSSIGKVGVETPATDAILNEVRAEGVEMYAQSLRRKQEDAFTESEHRHTKLGRAAVCAEKFAAQLRSGSSEGGV